MAFSPADFKYHIFLCTDATNPKCCKRGQSIKSWDFLKERIKKLGLEKTVNRTKADCLRVCKDGPIAVLYPGGFWYHSCTPEVLDRILTEHIQNGEVVKDYLLEENPLQG